MNLVGEDIVLMRKRYDEALEMRGIPCKYQFPNMPGTNNQGESVVDSYSEMVETYIFFDGNPKIKTFKRYGWVVENDKDLPFLVHCSFNLPHLQRDSLFHIGGQYAEMPDRVFRVIELTCDIQAPDHMIAQVVPVYDKQTVGRTKKEVAQTFNTSSHFLQSPTDYRGKYRSELDGDS
jgi:hypothetical protein